MYIIDNAASSLTIADADVGLINKLRYCYRAMFLINFDLIDDSNSN